jgi:parvulin-like peptidyl-prolyl isomerase
MRLGDADVARFLSTHEAEVKKKYADDERTYKNTNPALKLRAIQIAYAKPEAPTTPEKPAPTDDKKPADDKQPGDKKSDATKADDKKAGSGATPAVEAKADDKKAGSGATPPVKVTAADGSSTGLTVTEVKPGDKKPDTKAGADAKKPAGIPLADAKAKLEAARTAITSGKQKFADAAKALTTDEATKFNGGDMGWRPVQNAQLGDQAVNDAIKALKPGETTAVIVGESAVFLVTAEAKREGDLAYDAVKDEIATELAKDVWSKEAAKRAALDALATSHAGAAKNLTDLFERGVNEETERRRMQQLIEQQIGDQHGSIERPMKDIPAAWRGDDETPPASGGGSAPPATGSAAPKAGSAAPTAGSAAPKAGSAAPAAGSAAPAAGSGAGSATTTTPPAPPAPPAELVASKDVLPAFGDVKKPKVIPQGPVAREKSFPALEGVTDAGAILFDELQAGMLGKKVYETPDGFTLIQLTDKQQPKVEDFDKIADAEMAKLRSLRGRMAVEAWLKTRCKQLKDDGKIKPAADLVAEHDDAGKALPQVYQPCMSFR